MGIINSILSFLDWRVTTPSLYGAFHLISFAVMVLTIILLYILAKKNKKKTVKGFVALFAIVALVFEVIKQSLFTYSNDGSYMWYSFPFQFCSTPMYVAFISMFITNKSLKQKLYSFLAFYGLFGGLIVMVYPGDVFQTILLVNYQTMIHHAGMVVVAFILILTGAVKINKKNFADATLIFVIFVLVAFLMNISAYAIGLEDFNMFYISPFYVNHMPILAQVQANTPYIIFLLAYTFGFIFGAYIIRTIVKYSFNKLILK